MNTLYLTKGEMELFKKIPAAIRKAWDGKVEEEKGTAFETEEQLLTRRKSVPDEDLKSLEIIGRKFQVFAQGSQSLDSFEIDASPGTLCTALFLLGCKGIGDFINAVLSAAKSTEDCKTLESLSLARHALLQNNEKFLRQSKMYA